MVLQLSKRIFYYKLCFDRYDNITATFKGLSDIGYCYFLFELKINKKNTLMFEQR